MNYADESRQYQDRDGVVHVSSDTGCGNHITRCERYEADCDFFDTRDLEPVETSPTCVRCVTLPLRQWGRTLP
jgi:hypothetical protein